MIFCCSSQHEYLVYSSVTHLPGVFLPSDFLREYQIELIAMELPCSYLPNQLMIFCSEVPGSVTGCPCRVCPPVCRYSFLTNLFSIRSNDDDSTGFWPPGSLHTLGADGHIEQRDRLFMWIKILCIEHNLWGIPTIESTFDVANMVKTATVKDVPINNDAFLIIQACYINVWEIGICSPIW